MYNADKNDTIETAQEDLKDIYNYMSTQLPAIGGVEIETQNAFIDAVNLYILSANEKGARINGRELRQIIGDNVGFQITPSLALPSSGSSGVQSSQYFDKRKS